MLVKVVAVQAMMGGRITLEEKIHIFKQRPDFVCLPEYYLIDPTVTDYQRAALRQNEYLDYLCRLSDELHTCIVGGSIVEAAEGKLFNTSFVIDHGSILGKYRKRFPVPGELAKGISPGSDNLVVTLDGVRFAMMICGDVFYPHLYDELREAGADIIFVPTTSLYRPDDSLSQKKNRDQKYFLAGASQACAYVVKVCGVGEIFGRPLQGRSLIAAPWGILQQTTMYEESQSRILTTTLDINEVREFGQKLQASQARTDVHSLLG
ncbi:MAG: carbon-nitrogen hydrolase family protein [bacterium]|nr:carbon-nitrogen hydrolase family protein [bacterium]